MPAMNPNIGLTDKNRTAIIALLQPLLADEVVLYFKTRKAHWNVTGPHFHHLHKFFEEQYGAVEDNVDEIAERIRCLGGYPAATLAEYVKLARLKESPGKLPDAQGYLADLTQDHETLVRQLRKDLAVSAEKYGDAGTSDFLTGLMEAHEKSAWMLRTSLK